MGCVGRSSDGLVFTSALIPPRETIPTDLLRFFSLSLVERTFFFSLVLLASGGTLDARRFRFPLPFSRPCLMSGHIPFPVDCLREKEKKGEKIRGGGEEDVVVPFAFSHTVHFGSPLVSSPFNTIHCTAPSCFLISVFLSRYLHALRFAI